MRWTSLLVIVLLFAFAYGDGSVRSSDWCPLMFSLYGSCSEQLVSNYLAHTGLQNPAADGSAVPTNDSASSSLTGAPLAGNRTACSANMSFLSVSYSGTSIVSGCVPSGKWIKVVCPGLRLNMNPANLTKVITAKSSAFSTKDLKGCAVLDSATGAAFDIVAVNR